MTTDIFVYATRNKLRFASTRGELSVEQLWDVPLRSKPGDTGFSLDAIAKQANKALKEVSEESFVDQEKSPAQSRLEIALQVVKFVIDEKLADEAKADRVAKNKKEREQLLTILAEKQAGKLSELTEKELKRRIAALEE